MNSKFKILLIEDNLDRRKEFQTCIHFHQNFELYAETGSEKEGLRLIEKGNIDVVILDLELEEGNGIHLAEKMRMLSIEQPFTVVTTNNCSDAILQYMRKELKIDFIFQKINSSYSPNQVLSVIDKVYKFHKTKGVAGLEEKELLKQNILKELQNIGFGTQHMGTEYIAAALLLLSENQDNHYQISKTIYPALAKQYNTDPSNIEKSIRTAIERVWSTSTLLRLREYYPYDVDNKNGRPSNGEFIAHMKLRLFGK
ncbi:sporulation initiation factor Spo0A C-terminal domain-containing protein [Konateibacter massiliensis]|uniref:sporulation initiation factor Spo0A C-terminal domain-containing protein n=1 Tax=Konateibacter massiliensis TaxID=2002841 RepID=UPI000C160E11|nr:sporulation initiation factor Spo0A C-terminal domain-containing protein [Konateibacter massiliensis]